MNENIWKGNSDWFKNKIKEQWSAMANDENEEFEEKLRKNSLTCCKKMMI